ncbi:hypothetical protein G6F65_021439 [Rhizopus arrhizus]|nr:hypothetical protein G6F65_021439 [Rhizopus arrhizus]
MGAVSASSMSEVRPTLAPYPYRQDSSMTRDTPHIPARYLLFPLLAALIWAVNMIVTKMAAGVISPAVIGFYRWAIAGAVLTPFALPGVWAQRRLIVPYLPKFAVLGGLGMALYQGLAYVAASSTTATNMGIITAMIPLLTIAATRRACCR